MLQYIEFTFPEIPQVHCAFQMRGQGFSQKEFSYGNISLEVGDCEKDVKKNRKDILSTFKVKSFSDVKQVHGIETIFEPEKSKAGKITLQEADGMATTQRKHALCIKTADCQPILIAEKEGKHILALHCGWRGNRQAYPQIAIEDFCNYYKLDPKNLSAVRGPSLSPLVSEFLNYDKEWGEAYDKWFDPTSKKLNLWQMTKDQLLSAGIPHSQIYSIDICTYTEEKYFFSFRRERKTGRQGSFIWIK